MRNAVEAPVILRNGCWQNGACQREVRVRAVAEADEGLVDQLSAAALPLERDTRLLARCVLGLGSDEDVNQLSLGDRDTLLLHARRLTFGGQIDCVLPCPECEERMDFQLQVERLLAPQDVGTPSRFFEETLEAGGERFRVRFRVACGADLEDALNPPKHAPNEAVQTLLSHLVERVRPEEEPEDSSFLSAPSLPIEQWPAELAARVAERMAELDPQAETALQLTCPACQHSFTTSFNIGDYFFRELRARETRRYQEVHQLALAYHWSETEILSMSPRKRQIYLDLLAESSGD
jgi:hypothetical protein